MRANPDLVKEFLRESNAIEGTYDDDSLDQACVAWDWLMKQGKMTTSVLLKTHKILMLNQRGLMPNEKGYFRTIPVYIGGHEAMPAIRIESELEAWCKLMNRANKNRVLSDEDYSKALHVQYEHIHPFVDGNGRTGRMYMNWWRLRNNLPLLVIHEGEEQHAYYRWFA